MTEHRAENVIDHAEAAALFYRTLVDRGMPVAQAASVAGSYVSALVIAATANRNPPQPWDPGP